MRESNHLTKRTEPCICCNECVRVVNGKWAFNRVQWNYCNNKFGLPKLMEQGKTVKEEVLLAKRPSVEKRKLSRKDKKALVSTAEKFLEVMKEKITTYLWLEDVDALGRLVAQMDILSGYEVCRRCFGLVQIEENRQPLCWKCGQPRSKISQDRNHSGLCHDCSSVVNGRKQLGKRHKKVFFA